MNSDLIARGPCPLNRGWLARAKAIRCLGWSRITATGKPCLGGMPVRKPRIVLLLSLSLIASCGGGSGGESNSPTLSGVVALGAPVVGASVFVRCRTGSATVTTDASGSYYANIASVRFPCVIEASGGEFQGAANAQVLVSISTDGGVANATPLTHLLSARAFGLAPELAIARASDTDLALLTPGTLAARREAVNLEVARLGISLPTNLDPVKTAFVAQFTDGMDQTIQVVMRNLGYAAITLDEAARQIAIGPLAVRDGVSSKCKPGVISGFAGPVATDPLTLIPENSVPGGTGGGDGGTGAGVGGGDGAGTGGSLGQFKNTLVVVERADGKEIGRATTDATNGMVTIVPCQYAGPARVRFVGERQDSTYFDESLSQAVPFAGKQLCALVPNISKNIGVTPFTDAACAFMDAQNAVNGATPTATAWADKAKIQESNDMVKTQVNQHLASIFRVGDITRLPAIVGGTSPQQLKDTPNGRYGATLAGLVRASGEANPSLPSPALALTEILRRDLSDGKLDNFVGTGASIAASDSLYAFDALWTRATTGAGDTAKQIGVAGLSAKKFLMIDAKFLPYYIRLFSDGSMDAIQTDGAHGYTPVILAPGQRFTAVAFGEAAAIGLTSDGCLRTLNINSRFIVLRCGTPQASITSIAIASGAVIVRTSDGMVGSLAGVRAVAGLSAAPVAYALMEDGTVRGWFTRSIASFLQCSDRGDDRCDGRLLGHDSSFGYATTPTLIPGLNNIKALYSSLSEPDVLNFLAAIDRNGRVFEVFGPVPTEYKYPQPICTLDWPAYAVGCDGIVYNAKDATIAQGFPKAFRVLQGRALGFDGSFFGDGQTIPGPGDGSLQ